MVSLADDGLIHYRPDRRVAAWAAAAKAAAAGVLADPDERARWLRHDGTWFVGVDSLPTGEDGSIGDVPLAGPWEDAVTLPRPLHRAQLSAVFPGYPGRDPNDTDAAHRFRLRRDSAHLDGLLAEDGRRHLREPHAFVLGLPLTATAASPLVVWPGSHEVIREAFLAAFAGLPPALWPETDVTQIYREARAEVFDTCERVELPMQPGESVLMHRLLIHGVAPWKDAVVTPPEGRLVAYFRPVLGDVRAWLREP
ncbi:hypothetical protein [Wenxinia marina]|uniref:Protein involved in biosynthesis of mitomycin antibiotics/polyketide fumonisin n=1 Tax=Wenxinia marina DSM 24838 TaxID=1123501 RepID=A0A0D0Q4A7_9RHOB|nr:hypothetical protein [Wenxinia marina]KIQ69364.1 hypothetical protein Wenmar_01726 [Wenxinia marina DSM 24838]GGL57745.1 hypothetical protein GCM10011392_10220 [Wenxinia marina]